MLELYLKNADPMKVLILRQLGLGSHPHFAIAALF